MAIGKTCNLLQHVEATSPLNVPEDWAQSVRVEALAFD